MQRFSKRIFLDLFNTDLAKQTRVDFGKSAFLNT